MDAEFNGNDERFFFRLECVWISDLLFMLVDVVFRVLEGGMGSVPRVLVAPPFFVFTCDVNLNFLMCLR